MALICVFYPYEQLIATPAICQMIDRIIRYNFKNILPKDDSGQLCLKLTHSFRAEDFLKRLQWRIMDAK